MRNSVLPIPWTQRDSRPRSQAELDEEEQFDIYKEKALHVPRHLRTELDLLLDHYQHMIRRMIEEPGFVYRINLKGDHALREAQKRIEEGKALAKEKRLREEREPRERKSKAEPKQPPPYFAHLDQIMRRSIPEAVPEWLRAAYAVREAMGAPPPPSQEDRAAAVRDGIERRRLQRAAAEIIRQKESGL